MKVRVICMGNELVCDDGIGIRVGRVLSGLALPPGVTVEFRPRVGIELLDTLDPEERLILVDATQTGAKPGTCTCLTFSEVEAMAQAPFCSHRIGLSEVLQLARQLAPSRLPPELVTVGIEAATLDHYGMELSDEVRNALPEAVEIVLRLVDASDALVEAGIERAREAMEWVPKPFELMG